MGRTIMEYRIASFAAFFAVGFGATFMLAPAFGF
jgi:hypothetical protein